MKKNIAMKLVAFSSMLVPLTAVISCASRGGSDWHLSKKDNTYDSLTKDSKEILTKSESSYDKVKNQAYYFLYEEEQKGSIDLQKDYFAWERYSLEKDIVEEVPELDGKIIKGKNIEKKDSYGEVINEKIERWIKLNEIDIDNWEEQDQLYESDTFSSDYPYVLVSLDKIKENQKKIYEDRKNNYIKTFEKKAPGEDEWTKELSENYGGAYNDEEAVDYLVLNQIKPTAFGRYSYSINDLFTQEQYDFAKENNFEHFSFLKNASTKSEDSKDEDKVYFIGNESKIPSIINKAPELEHIDEQTLFRHFLISASPDENGYDLPWKIAASDIKNLFSFENIDSDNPNQKQAYQYIPKIFSTWKDKDEKDANGNPIPGDIFDSVNTKDAKFLKFYSNNSEGGKDKGGSLGSNKPLDFVAGMVPGFQLGVMKYIQDKVNNSSNTQSTILTTLVTKLEEAYYDILDEAGIKDDDNPTNGNKDEVDAKIQTQEDLKQWWTKIDDQRMEEIVGNKIREVFDANQKNGIDQFYYRLTDKRFVVISSHGIHIVAYSDDFDISDKNELQKMADEQSKDVDELNYIENVQTYYSEWRQFLEVLEDKKFYDPSNNTGFLQDNKESLITEDDQANDVEKIFDEAKKFAQQKIENSSFESIRKISQNYDWLLNQYDKELREENQTSYKPEKLYEKAKEFGGVE